MYVVTVRFDVAPDRAEAFAEAVRAQARNSLEREPACRRFDVCTDPGDTGRVFLYEIYDDRAAFDAHLASPHFAAFDAAVGPWVTAKSVETWTLE